MSKTFVFFMVLMFCLLCFTNVYVAQGKTIEKIEGEREEPKEQKEKTREIEITGEIEFDVFYVRKEEDGVESKKSDAELGSIEVGVSVQFSDSIRGYAQFQSDNSGEVTTEECTLHFQAEDVMEPDISLGSTWYVSLGKMTVPFGNYDSRLPSDSYLTRELGKVEETALVLGAYVGTFNFTIGLFNGDVDEVDSNDHIKNYTGTLFFSLPENAAPGLELKAGGSYISNITDSKKLKKLFPSGEIEKHVSGFNSFISASFMKRYFIETEYIASMDSFSEDGNRIKPKAWNFEFGFLPLDPLEMAFRYGFSESPSSFLPKKQLGVAGIFKANDSITISLEYLYDEFENKVLLPISCRKKPV